MKQTRIIMGMPITLEMENAGNEIWEQVFQYFHYVDEKFSPFKQTSELSQINRAEIKPQNFSSDMRLVLDLCQQAKKNSGGYFDIVTPEGKLNPSGLVKGWAILNAAKMISAQGIKNFYVEAGGDIQAQGKFWKIGIRNPFDTQQIIKVVYLKDKGIATSGTYIRGQHIYNPFEKKKQITDIVSLTVIGPNVYEADVLATSAFAMGKDGIFFIEKQAGFEGYMVDNQGQATMTTNFEKYLSPSAQ